MNVVKFLHDFLQDDWILILEQTQNYRNSLRQFLNNLKIKNFKLVGSVEEARRELATINVKMIICEWSISKVNGLQFCRDLRKEEQYDHLPFLLMSVENRSHDVILACEMGVSGYLLKPFSFEEFRDQLVQVIKDHQLPSQLTKILVTGDREFSEGHFEKAAELYKKGYDMFPQSARSLCGLGAVYEKKNSRIEAIKYYREAVRVNPSYLDAYKALLRIYEKEDNVHGMLNVALKLHELSPDNPRYTLLLARCYLEIKDYKNSEIFFRKTIRVAPTIAEAYRGLGNVYMIQEEYDKAKQNFHKAIDLDGHDISTLNSLGLIYVKQGKYKEGIEMYLIALKVNNNDVRVLFNLGYAFERQKLYEQAFAYYNKALIADPEYDKAVTAIQRLKATKQAS